MAVVLAAGLCVASAPAQAGVDDPQTAWAVLDLLPRVEGGVTVRLPVDVAAQCSFAASVVAARDRHGLGVTVGDHGLLSLALDKCAFTAPESVGVQPR